MQYYNGEFILVSYNIITIQRLLILISKFISIYQTILYRLIYSVDMDIIMFWGWIILLFFSGHKTFFHRFLPQQ